MWRQSVRLEIGGMEENLQLVWHPSRERSAKTIFSSQIIHFTIFNAIILELRACLAQNKMAQEQP